MGTRSEGRHGDGLTFEIADRADAICAEQLEASDVYPGEEHERDRRVNLDEQRRAQ